MRRRHVLAGLGAMAATGCSKIAAATATWGANALQERLAALSPGETLNLGSGTYIVDAPLDGRHLRNVKLVGQAILKAAAGTGFEFVLDISHAVGVEIDGLTFDANKVERGSAAGRLSCLKANRTTDCALTRCTFKGSLGYNRRARASSAAVEASDRCTRLRVDRCNFLDCGISANSRPSDGIYLRGDDCVITGCHAERVTDTAFVLEGCNYSQIVDCTGTSCTSLAGISNDMDADIEGNVISGVSGTSSHFGSFGGVVGVFAFGRGKIKNCTLSRIDIRPAAHAVGGGAALYFLGGVAGIDVSDVSIDAGATKGAMSHGIVMDGVAGVRIRDSRIRTDGIGSCIRLLNNSRGVTLERNTLEHGAYGIYADGSSRFAERGNRFEDCRTPLGLAGGALRM